MTKLTIASLSLIATLGLFAGGSASAATLPDGNGGAVCKGIGSCLVLELDCKGTYTDATQPDGTVYGKCTKVQARTKGFKAN